MRGGAFFNGKEGRVDFRENALINGKEGRVDFRITVRKSMSVFEVFKMKEKDL